MNNNPLEHPTLTLGEMSLIADVCNPGFKLQRELGDSNDALLAQALMVAQALRLNVEDSFRIYPGAFEAKWQVDRNMLISKLAAMSTAELNEVADRVDQFWEPETYELEG